MRAADLAQTYGCVDSQRARESGVLTSLHITELLFKTSLVSVICHNGTRNNFHTSDHRTTHNTALLATPLLENTHTSTRNAAS